MKGRYRFARENRLVRKRDFERVYRGGERYSAGALIAYVLPCPGKSFKIGFTVSKAVGGAVDRNRVKRILRETYRLNQHRLKPGTLVVIVARSVARELSSRALSGTMLRLFKKSGITCDA